MSGVATLEIAPEDGAQRLDRWFKRRYPALGHGRLEKLLRTGQIRVNGKRARAGTRLEAGDRVRVPPLPDVSEARAPSRPAPPLDDADADMVRSAVIYRDGDMIALNKPPGLPVQGGSRVARHLDGMLDALRFDAAEAPRLVHRLDRDTSGVLLLARHAAAAREFTALFPRPPATKAILGARHRRAETGAGADRRAARQTAGGRGRACDRNRRRRPTGDHGLHAD